MYLYICDRNLGKLANPLTPVTIAARDWAENKGMKTPMCDIAPGVQAT